MEVLLAFLIALVTAAIPSGPAAKRDEDVAIAIDRSDPILSGKLRDPITVRLRQPFKADHHRVGVLV